MESKSYGRDAVISTTQLVQYEDDDDNEDKLDSSHSDQRAPSREGNVDLGGGGQSLDPHLDGQSHLVVQAGMSHEELAQNIGMDLDRDAEGEEHEGQDISEGEMIQEGEVGPGGDLASEEAMRVYCAYDTTDVVHGDLNASSTQGPGGHVNEYTQEDELQERVLEGVLEEAPGDQGGYIADEAGGVEEASSFSEMQQTQLRAQILIYGDLIKGVLPEHNLMLTAFSDGPEAFGQESDRSNSAGWNWEQHWQVAALKHQSEVERQAEEELAKDKGDVTMAEGEQLENALTENLEPGVSLMSVGIAANVDEEPGSRKRKKGAGKTREKKATTTTPRPRARARKGSAAPVASPPTSLDPKIPTPQTIYESSAAAVVASAASPTTPLASTLVERRDGLGRQSLHTDTANWVEQARVSFEEAMSAANSAQQEAQLVTTQTPQNRVPGNEAKYASAADAVKVAASVAKAAADAAKVAYEAALQARIYAFEGVEGSSGRNFAASLRADKDGGAGGRRSAIAAAKEEARKRASGTPGAGKANPQSTDAVLRAAKLMTEAAAEAGAVLAKGNSTPSTSFLSPPTRTLASSGEGEKKSKSSERRGRPRKEVGNAKKAGQPDATSEQHPVKTPKDGKQSGKKGARRKGKDALDAVASAAKTPPKKAEDSQAKQSPDKSIRRQLEQSMALASNATDTDQQFAEGSLVEVMNDEEGLRGGWFSAQVLELKPGQAYVQYDEILTDDGKTKLKEWFPLEGKMEGPEPGRPRIRLISPDNMAREEGKQDKQRKRRRTATKERAWAVGDRADAFVQDGWWEGIVKSVDEDENKVTIHFPGEGDTQTVKAKNLRPSLVWKNGKWEQWTGYGNTQGAKKDEDQSAKRQKSGISPKAQARKTRRKSSSEVKAFEEGKDSPRTTRRGKPLDFQGENQPSPALVTTRSSPRQKLPPKRKDGASKLASPESEV
ncbi:hypothetical protein Mapa_007906 [Marchantia paleacea]|nr:hypothetical protein Mapa_007906 [Marchantia paleacea]